jgi:hypothetical protein
MKYVLFLIASLLMPVSYANAMTATTCQEGGMSTSKAKCHFTSSPSDYATVYKFKGRCEESVLSEHPGRAINGWTNWVAPLQSGYTVTTFADSGCQVGEGPHIWFGKYQVDMYQNGTGNWQTNPDWSGQGEDADEWYPESCMG